MEQKKNKGGLQGCLTAFIIFAIISVLFGIFIRNYEQDSKNGVAKYIEIDEPKAESIDNILSECDITKITGIRHDEILDNWDFEGETGYRINTKDVPGEAGILLYLDGEQNVYLIKYGDTNLYADGAVQYKLTDFVISIDEASDYQIKAKEAVKSILKSPSTAKFPSLNEWGMEKNHEVFKIGSYVDSQNSFGAMIRNQFVITYSRETQTVTSFIFDGQEYIQQ